MKNSKSIIDLILTNKPLHFQKTCVVKTGLSDYHLHFQKTCVVETGLSDYHKMISAFFKACSSKIKN